MNTQLASIVKGLLLKILTFSILLQFTFYFNSSAQDTWSKHILKLDTLDVNSPDYGKTAVHISWQIVHLSADTAMYYADLAYEFAEKHGMDSVRSRALLSRSTVHSRMGEHTQAIEEALEALRFAEEIADTVTMYDASTNLAIDKYYLDDKQASLKYFQQAAGYLKDYRADSRKSRNRYAATLLNLANIQDALGKTAEVIDTYFEALVIFESTDNYRSIAATQFNLAMAYQRLNQFDSAEIYYDKSSKNYEEHVQTSGLSDVLTNWANMKIELGAYGPAIDLLRRSLKLSIETENKLQEQYACKELSSAFAATQQYDSAYHYQGRYQELLNESRELEKQQYADDLLAKYETEQKEQQIANLEQENQIKDLEAARQRQWIVFSLFGALLLMLAVVLLYLRYKDKNRANAMLDAKNQELARLNATKDRLFSIISHDLKSPLSSFHSITSSLYTNWDHIEKDQLKDFILSLRDSSADLKGMMNNLLKWALAQSDQLKYDPVATNPSSIIAEVTRELKTLADLKEISIELNAEDIEIEADRDFLQIVFRNLLSNAMKFSEMKSKIEVMVEEQERDKLISIRDYGVGMDQRQVEDLMGGKITAHEIQNSDQKGTGLGLVLCRELLDRMNAKMEVESVVGKGTTFKIVFPRAA